MKGNIIEQSQLDSWGETGNAVRRRGLAVSTSESPVSNLQIGYLRVAHRLPGTDRNSTQLQSRPANSTKSIITVSQTIAPRLIARNHRPHAQRKLLSAPAHCLGGFQSLHVVVMKKIIEPAGMEPV
jgi:hypothetical protein